MSHQSLRLLIRDAAQSVGDNIQFGYGRRSDYNLINLKSFPFVWLLPLTSSASFVNNNSDIYQKTWNVVLIFIDLDKSDSKETQFDDILDRMDTLVDQVVNRINDWYLHSSDVVGTLTMRNITQNPIIKEDSSINTGWIVTFQVTLSQDFDYCKPENIALYTTQ